MVTNTIDWYCLCKISLLLQQKNKCCITIIDEHLIVFLTIFSPWFPKMYPLYDLYATQYDTVTNETYGRNRFQDLVVCGTREKRLAPYCCRCIINNL